MIKNLTPNQLLLIAIATVLLILAGFSFYLLQDPSAPLPFAPAPATPTSTPLPPALTSISPPTALTPTKQTSYTPFSAFVTPNTGTPPATPIQSEATLPIVTSSLTYPTSAPTNRPTGTLRSTITPNSATPTNSQGASSTPSPTTTETLSPGEYGVTGRVVQNGTPVANVLVEFADDVSPRQTTTNSSGLYWFTTLAPEADFTLTFNQSDNLRLTPTAQVASLAWIEGALPTGVDIINLPDFEVSTNLNGMFFELLTPTNGFSFSASAISASNPIPFAWSFYYTGETYMVQLGQTGSNDSIWSSDQLSSTSYMWNGTLDDGTHITQGSYWWEVSVTKPLANYILVVFTQQFQIQFNP